MTTFSLLLLAWPFYLAIHGRLADYITLAKPSSSTASASSPTSDKAS